MKADHGSYFITTYRRNKLTRGDKLKKEKREIKEKEKLIERKNRKKTKLYLA